MEHILIIGAGQAAHAAILELERLEFPGRITLVSAEPHLPYERPPLSKEVLVGPAAENPEGIYFRPKEDYQKEHLEFRSESTVAALDTANKLATLGNGEQIAFDKCLIATGSTPRILAHLEPSPRVHYFRTWEDALRLKDCLKPGTRLGIIGAGFLGLELASSATTLGVETEVFERSERILPLHAPSFLSDWFRQQAKTHGVKLHNPVEQLTLEVQDEQVLISYNDEACIPVQHVAVTIGSQPNDGLAKQAGIATHPDRGGIVIDHLGRTSAEGIFAAGDCATYVIPENNTARRIESWQNANEQGRIDASAMTGAIPDEADLAWFWTDVFGANIQIYGHYDPKAAYVPKKFSGDADKQLSIGEVKNKIIHAITNNAAREIRPLKRLIEQVIQINVCEFGKPEATTRDFARAAMAKQRAQTEN